MNTSFLIMLIVSAVLLMISVILLINNRKIHKDIDRLSAAIENEKLTEYSTADNHFSRLHNAVADLENRLRLEKSSTARESKKNSEFISDISHQLKTPLAAMRLYVEMEYGESPNEHTEKELQLIDKMENLIYKLLRLEKIKSDSYVMDFGFCDIKEVADEVVSEFRPLFPNKQYIVTGESHFRLDKAWLSEALGNVIKNASEHTDDNGKIEITIEGSEQSTTVSIKDNGGGVPEDELSKLFQRFHRTENANPNSVGIGLAITKAIVEKHHGTITAENTGEGLNMIMCFPHIDGAIAI